MIDLTNLRHGDTITVLPKEADVISKPWTATVGDVIINADGVPGVWTTGRRWVPAHRIEHAA